MQQRLKIGPEQEFNLNDKQFMVSDMAAQVLDHHANIKPNGDPYFVKEGTNAQIEHNWLPSENIDDLCLEFLNANRAVEEMLQSSESTKDIKVIPITENGAGLATRSSRVGHRTPIYEAIFGPVEHLIRISGIHNHVDRCPQYAIEEFNILAALVPGIALSSNSPIDYRRVNGFNDSRYNLFANPETGYFRNIPERLDYIKEMQDLVLRDNTRYSAWREAYRNSVGDTILFDENFSVANTGYPDIRDRPDVGTFGTYEVRRDDSTTLDIHLGNTAMILGSCNIVCKGINVGFAEVDGDYYFNSGGEGRIILPTRNYLVNTLIRFGVETGLQSDEVNDYLKQLLNFAIEGLPGREQHYLNPLYAMVEERKNLSTQVLEHLRTHKHKPNKEGVYGLEAVQEANKFVWEKQQKAIEHFTRFHDYRK